MIDAQNGKYTQLVAQKRKKTKTFNKLLQNTIYCQMYIQFNKKLNANLVNEIYILKMAVYF